MVHPLLFAFLAPLGWATASIIDKYVLVHKIRRLYCYIAMVGLLTILIGLILAAFLDWSSASLANISYPAISGTLLGAFIYFYFLILEKEDVAHLTGFNYLYPAIAAVLSFVVLRETIPLEGYLGMAFTLVGVLLLSLRMSRIKLRTQWWMIAAGISILSVWALFAKLAATNLPSPNAVAVSCIAEGAVLSLILLYAGVRDGFLAEIKNAPWATLSEAFNISGHLFGFLALAALPVAIVSSIAGIQPLLILIVERIVDAFGGRISRDQLLLPKLVPIVLITIGVILLSWAGYS